MTVVSNYENWWRCRVQNCGCQGGDPGWSGPRGRLFGNYHDSGCWVLSLAVWCAVGYPNSVVVFYGGVALILILGPSFTVVDLVA